MHRQHAQPVEPGAIVGRARRVALFQISRRHISGEDWMGASRYVTWGAAASTYVQRTALACAGAHHLAVASRRFLVRCTLYGRTIDETSVLTKLGETPQSRIRGCRIRLFVRRLSSRMAARLPPLSHARAEELRGMQALLDEDLTAELSAARAPRSARLSGPRPAVPACRAAPRPARGSAAAAGPPFSRKDGAQTDGSDSRGSDSVVFRPTSSTQKSRQ